MLRGGDGKEGHSGEKIEVDIGGLSAELPPGIEATNMTAHQEHHRLLQAAAPYLSSASAAASAAGYRYTQPLYGNGGFYGGGWPGMGCSCCSGRCCLCRWWWCNCCSRCCGWFLRGLASYGGGEVMDTGRIQPLLQLRIWSIQLRIWSIQLLGVRTWSLRSWRSASAAVAPLLRDFRSDFERERCFRVLTYRNPDLVTIIIDSEYHVVVSTEYLASSSSLLAEPSSALRLERGLAALALCFTLSDGDSCLDVTPLLLDTPFFPSCFGFFPDDVGSFPFLRIRYCC